jgi:hypothetical protein
MAEDPAPGAAEVKIQIHYILKNLEEKKDKEKCSMDNRPLRKVRSFVIS